MRPALSASSLVRALVVAGLLAPQSVAAQEFPQGTLPGPLQLQPTRPVQPSAPVAPSNPAPPGPKYGVLTLAASFADSGKPIQSGLVWRVYEDKGDGAEPVLVQKVTAPAPSIPVPPGNYVVHAAYGFTSATRRISMQWGNVEERLAITAGALRLKGVVGDWPIPPAQLTFSVFVPVGNDPEGRLVIANASGGEVIRLPEGSYHVVSTYGDANAIMRTDLRVEAGRVTEATVNHRAASVTLKLVAQAGGEAFAGTAFSVLTPGGDVVREAIGAFPQVTLAEGEYVLIARHDGQVYTREFKIESGLDRDVEVLAGKS